MLLPNYPIVFRKRRASARSLRPQPTPPIAALTLVSATFNGTFTITLDFDRAIDISAFNGPAITLVDGPDGLLWKGQNATLLSDTSARIALTNVGGAEGDDVLLTASGATGIIASDDGGTWAGASDLVLPFG